MSVALRDSTVADGLAAEFPSTVTIANGATTASVTAVVNRTDTWPGDGSDTHDLYERREFDIAVSSYTVASEPAEGHTVTDASGVVWRVMPTPGGEPKPWRYVNQSRTVYRIQAWRGK